MRALSKGLSALNTLRADVQSLRTSSAWTCLRALGWPIPAEADRVTAVAAWKSDHEVREVLPAPSALAFAFDVALERLLLDFALTGLQLLLQVLDAVLKLARVRLHNQWTGHRHRRSP